MKDKTPNDVRGKKINCINFEQCPFCYGCRNFNSQDPECLICEKEDKKTNLCKKELHTVDNINKMIIRQKIKVAKND